MGAGINIQFHPHHKWFFSLTQKKLDYLKLNPVTNGKVQPISENALPFKTFWCGCPYEKKLFIPSQSTLKYGSENFVAFVC